MSSLIGPGGAWNTGGRNGSSSNARHASLYPDDRQLPDNSRFNPYSRPQIQATRSYSPPSSLPMYSPGLGNDTTRVKQRRKKTTPAQLEVLVTMFLVTDSPSFDQRESIKEKVNMTNREVQVWFQNRRAKVNRAKAEEEEGPLVDSPNADSTGRASHSVSPIPPCENALGFTPYNPISNDTPHARHWQIPTPNCPPQYPAYAPPPGAPSHYPTGVGRSHSTYECSFDKGYLGLPTPPSPSSNLADPHSFRASPPFQAHAASSPPFIAAGHPCDSGHVSRRNTYAGEAFSGFPFSGNSVVSEGYSLSTPLVNFPLDNLNLIATGNLSLPRRLEPELAYRRYAAPLPLEPTSPNNRTRFQLVADEQYSLLSLPPSGWDFTPRAHEDPRELPTAPFGFADPTPCTTTGTNVDRTPIPVEFSIASSFLPHKAEGSMQQLSLEDNRIEPSGIIFPSLDHVVAGTVRRSNRANPTVATFFHQATDSFSTTLDTPHQVENTEPVGCMD